MSRRLKVSTGCFEFVTSLWIVFVGCLNVQHTLSPKVHSSRTLGLNKSCARLPVAKIRLLAPPIPYHDELSDSSVEIFLPCELDHDSDNHVLLE